MNLKSLFIGIRNWEYRSACYGAPSEWFFPDEVESHKAISEAKLLCAECDVRRECLNYAVEANEPWGIWGGLDTRERRRYIKLKENTKQQPFVDLCEVCQQTFLNTRNIKHHFCRFCLYKRRLTED